MWPFKKSESQLNSKLELALSIRHLDKARQYFVLAVLETMLPAKDDRQKMLASMSSLYKMKNPFMQPGSTSAIVGGMMSDDFSCNAYETALHAVGAGIGNGLFSLTDVLDVLKQQRETLEKEAQSSQGVTPGQLNPPWNDGI